MTQTINPSAASSPSVLKTKSTRRIKSALRTALKCGDRIGQLAEKKRQALEHALASGLQMNQPIEINGEQWIITEPNGRFVYFSKAELKKLAKNPRSPQPQPAPTAEAGV